MKYILGVDPGLSGALAVIDPECDQVVALEKMPATKRGSRSDLNLSDLAIFLDTHAPKIKCAVVEDVAAAPKQGVTGMFTFGKVTGIVVGMIAAHYIPIYYVKPSVWKFQMGLTKDKKLSIKKANQIYFKHGLGQVRNDGLAEALLLAHFGKRFFDV